MYSIDTNIYLDWWIRRYPEDIFPTYRLQVEGLIAAGKWQAVERVQDEINHVGTTSLKTWAKAQRSQFIKHDGSLILEAKKITTSYPGLIDPYARHDEADRYVIALAKLKGWDEGRVLTLDMTKHTFSPLQYVQCSDASLADRFLGAAGIVLTI